MTYQSSNTPEEEATQDQLHQALELLRKVLDHPTAPAAFPEKELPPELANVTTLRELYAALWEVRSFTLAVANGDLSRPLPLKGYTAGSLKMLQANLSHLTWQAQSIAGGDFSQRVDFMGDFSQAFNSMVEQFSNTLDSLRDKEQALIRANAELQQEIEQRRSTEEELRRSQEKYRELASIDPLTGLANRRHFFTLALAELQRACRFGHHLAIIMLDLDHFKKTNDTWGHAVGDKVLQSVAARCKEVLRTVDVIARYGGEEFVLLLPETSSDGAEVLAERLREALAEPPLQIGASTIPVTASLGACAYSPIMGSQCSPEDLERLLTLADQALYQAKNAGRNRVISCDAN